MKLQYYYLLLRIGIATKYFSCYDTFWFADDAKSASELAMHSSALGTSAITSWRSQLTCLLCCLFSLFTNLCQQNMSQLTVALGYILCHPFQCVSPHHADTGLRSNICRICVTLSCKSSLPLAIHESSVFCAVVKMIIICGPILICIT